MASVEHVESERQEAGSWSKGSRASRPLRPSRPLRGPAAAGLREALPQHCLLSKGLGGSRQTHQTMVPRAEPAGSAARGRPLLDMDCAHRTQTGHPAPPEVPNRAQGSPRTHW